MTNKGFIHKISANQQKKASNLNRKQGNMWIINPLKAKSEIAKMDVKRYPFSLVVREMQIKIIIIILHLILIWLAKMKSDKIMFWGCQNRNCKLVLK